MTQRIIDTGLILDINKWPGKTLCMKRKAKPGEKAGVMGNSVYGVLTNNRAPFIIYLEPNYIREQEYNTMDEMFSDGWSLSDAPKVIILGNYTPVAAKDYICQCCGLTLEAGKKYKKQVVKTDEGKIETYRMHIIGMCIWKD